MNLTPALDATYPPLCALEALGDRPLTDDAIDAHIRPLFSRVLQRDGIYLANHSLGRPLDQMAEDVRLALDAWYTDMDAAWDFWLNERETYRSLMAALIGCADASRVVPKTSVAQGLRAVLGSLPLKDGPTRVVLTRGEFDSVDFTIKAWAHKGRVEPVWVAPGDDGRFDARDVCAAIDEQTDLVIVSQVVFATGQVFEGIDEIIAAAHARGAKVLLDTYHAAGVMPVGFDELGADFAAGGNYKYTRGGPGACWLAVHPRHLGDGGVPARDSVFPIDTGWFAKESPFGYARSDEPRFAGGGDAWLEATPPVLTYSQAKSGLAFTLGVGVERLRAHNLELQGYLIERFREYGVEPLVLASRGAFVLVPHGDTTAVTAGLAEHGVNVDARPLGDGRGVVRFCPDVLTTRSELEAAAAATAAVLRVVSG